MMTLLFLTISLLFLDACSRQYAPDSQASGEQIYRSACLECHKPAPNGSIFMLKAKQANLAYIGGKIHNGSLLMPSFPHMNAADLKKVSMYALQYTDITGE